MDLKHVLKDWLIPPGFIRVSKKFSRTNRVEPKVTAPSKNKYQLRDVNQDLTSFKGMYSGKRCFILATGPSIKHQDLSILEGEHCIAVSMFHLHEQLKVIKPIWHVLAPSHPPFKFDTLERIFDTANSSYADSDKINFLLGVNNYEYSYLNYLVTQASDFYVRFKNHIYFADYNNSPNLDESNFQHDKVWDLNGNPFGIRTVIYLAIQLAYYLGFTEIVLVGCDHDYLTDINRVENHHFYEENKGFSDKEHLSGFDRERWFLEYYSRWKHYRLMRDFLNRNGVIIVNATAGGMLDVFPRRDLKSFFND